MTEQNKPTKTLSTTKAIFQDIANPEYVQALSGIWAYALDLVTYSNKPMTELYRLASILKIFAYPTAKLEKIRKDIDEAVKSNDAGELRKLLTISKNLQNEKAISLVYDQASKEYDRILKDTLQELDSTGLMIVNYKSSEEIYKECLAYLGNSGKNTEKDIQKLAELARLNLNL